MELKHRLRDLLACPECGAYPFDMTVLESERGPEPPTKAGGCERFCSWQGRPVQERSVVPCSQCYSTEIVQGILHCPDCRAEYPIIDGIPRFNPDVRGDYPQFFLKYGSRFRHAKPGDVEGFNALHTETKRSFGFQWLRYEVTGREEDEETFYLRTDTSPGTLTNQLFFEAGCGMGRYLKVIGAEPAAEVVGLDLSLAVNRAHRENLHNPRVHVVQGNILQLPLLPDSFDHVYSIGVLHHTPSTEQAFRSMVKLVKPGGRVSLWVYHVWRSPEMRGFKALHAQIKGSIADNLRRVTTRLPLLALHYLCYLAVPLGWLQRRISQSPGPIRALFSPVLLFACSNHPSWKIRLLDTFDWYSPRFQWKHTVAEVAGWFRSAGLVDIATSGFPVSVRGRRPSAAQAPEEDQRHLTRAAESARS